MMVLINELEVPVIFAFNKLSGLNPQFIILSTYICLSNKEKFSLQVLKIL